MALFYLSIAKTYSGLVHSRITCSLPGLSHSALLSWAGIDTVCIRTQWVGVDTCVLAYFPRMTVETWGIKGREPRTWNICSVCTLRAVMDPEN